MKPANLTLRCMAWNESGQWVAACIDFTLAAQGSTLDEAKARLHEQIVTYVTEALGVDSAHVEELLSRRAPLYDRLRYGFWSAVNRRPRIRRTAGRVVRGIGIALAPKRSYIEPLPLHA